ncbi:MAG: class D beta-lactamase [Anaerolineales bacterium]|nr:class D beta-lactamase [Anaerolineales bacterium]
MIKKYSVRLVTRLFLSLFLVGCGVAADMQTTPTLPEPTVLPTPQIKPELEKYFQGFTGCFVLYDQKADSYIRYNPEVCAKRLLPASTFKIINSLIGLETGVIPDENYLIKWDGQVRSLPVWNYDHTLKSAFRNSVVWYYQELARRVGKEKMQQYIDAAGYGNQDISGNIDSFWLDGAIRISADEQVELLKRLYSGDLPFSERSIKIVREMMILDTKEAYQLSGKTGAGQVGGISVGWFVGTLETNGNVYFFAANIQGTLSQDANGANAKQIALDVLNDLDLLP